MISIPTRRIARASLIAMSMAALVGTTAVSTATAAPRTKLISKATSGQPNDHASEMDMTPDARFVVFESRATNLVANDTNGDSKDVFIRDRKKGKAKLLSKSSAGLQGTGGSNDPSVSNDGRFVAFSSSSVALPAGGGFEHIYVHDRRTKKTKLVSKSSSGVAGDSTSNHPNISGNGRYVVFNSYAKNLVPGDLNSSRDVFIHDRNTKKTKLVSRSSGGAKGDADSRWPDISDDGRFIVYTSDAKNLVANDANDVPDVFIWDRRSKATELASRSSAGVRGNDPSTRATISGNGRFVAFITAADNLFPDGNGHVDIVVFDRQKKRLQVASRRRGGAQANGNSSNPEISRTGRYVVFPSAATNLAGTVTGAYEHIYRFDRKTRKTKLISRSSSGAKSDQASYAAVVSGYGRWVAFSSEGGNLAPNDGVGNEDVFVRGPL